MEPIISHTTTQSTVFKNSQPRILSPWLAISLFVKMVLTILLFRN